jgi:hypothetical protein
MVLISLRMSRIEIKAWTDLLFNEIYSETSLDLLLHCGHRFNDRIVVRA